MIKKPFILKQVAVAALCAASAGAMARSVPNRLIVEFYPNTATSAVDSVNLLNRQTLASTPVGSLQLVSQVRKNQHVVRFATSLKPSEAAALLKLDPRVRFAQPDYLLHLLDEPNQVVAAATSLFQQILTPFAAVKTLDADPEIPTAPALPNPAVADPELSKAWGLSKIQATEAWDTVAKPAEIIVADIDTGIDYTHEDLMNNLWRNPNPTQNDVVGYDFANNDAKPYDDQGHGTHTAGTIGAVRGNGKGVAGVAPNAKIMALKFITAAGSGTTSDAVRAIDYAVAHGARVLSNSWGGYADDPDETDSDNKALYDSVKRAGDKNVLFIAAAGNDGADNDKRAELPAGMDLANIIAVASTNDQDHRSFFSNFGATTVDVAAPGSNVYSTMPGNKYGQESGTSMACPHVAGLAALILSERPELTAAQVKEIILGTVDRLSTLEGKILSGGRVNAAAALRKAKAFGI